MGMDAKAYLWWGTTTREELPAAFDDCYAGREVDADGEVVDWGYLDEALVEAKLAPLRVELVQIGYDGPQYALACRDTLHFYDWDFETDTFELDHNDCSVDAIRTACAALGWDFDPRTCAWHLGADFS